MNIPSQIFSYLETEKVGVLAVEMLDGSPHAATVHFAHTEEPFVFFFETYREYRKAESILAREQTRASFVVGTTEDATKTLQLDGVILRIKEEERGMYNSVYLGKFPKKLIKSKDPKFICFKFIPFWWKFTDWQTPEGKKIWISTDK